MTIIRRNELRGIVWMLSKLMTQSEGTPSSVTVSSSSDTRPRTVRVRAATTTAPIRSATGSRALGLGLVQLDRRRAAGRRCDPAQLGGQYSTSVNGASTAAPASLKMYTEM